MQNLRSFWGLPAPPDPQLYLAMTYGHCRFSYRAQIPTNQTDKRPVFNNCPGARPRSRRPCKLRYTIRHHSTLNYPILSILYHLPYTIYHILSTIYQPYTVYHLPCTIYPILSTLCYLLYTIQHILSIIFFLPYTS